MKTTAIALACLLGGVQGWAEDMELAAAHSTLPSSWKICKVFTLRNLYTSDRLYTASRSEAEAVRKIPIRIKQRLGPFELGIGGRDQLVCAEHWAQVLQDHDRRQ